MLDDMREDHFDNHGHIESCWAKKRVSICQDITKQESHGGHIPCTVYSSPDWKEETRM